LSVVPPASKFGRG